MSEVTTVVAPKKRGRPPKNKTPTVETNSASFEYNTNLGTSWLLYSTYGDTFPYTIDQINGYIKQPMENNKQLREVAWLAYYADGSVSSSIEYMRSMPTLDGVVVNRSPRRNGEKPKNFERNKSLMKESLNKIKYDQQVRDILLNNANSGASFYYFETTEATPDKTKFMSDIDVLNITEINALGINASVISLPIDYCKIIGRKNNSYVGAFDLKYFTQYTENERTRRLRAFPKEIRDGFAKYDQNKESGSWIVLDNTKTIITKINSKMSDPWGVPLAICALDDITYADYFVNTKRAVLNDINNQIVYETFPEAAEKGKCALTKDQQEKQHNLVKSAINTKSAQSGRTFFSLSAGTKLEKLDVNIDLFDEKNEKGIKDAVPSSLGVAASALNGNTDGNYAAATLNMELVFGRVFLWIKDIFDELNKCINENIIKDRSCVVAYVAFPTTYANRDKFFEYMKTLYADCGGSLQAVIAASGMDVDGYMSLMDYERENKFDEKYPPHLSRNTMSSKDSDTGGRPTKKSDNPRSIQTKTNGSNETPKPSTR